MNLIYIALGGAAGAVFRYLISIVPVKVDFPMLTLLTNFAGAIIIGMVAGFSVKKGMSDKYILFLKTGFCGGFTTFSTFSLESYSLLRDGRTFPAMIYICLSVTLCMMGVLLGNLIAERAI